MGSDLFVLVADEDNDRITDFDITEDTIDLSGWSNFKNPADLAITHISGGVRITWQDEVLDVYSSTSGRMDIDEFLTTIRSGPTRTAEAPIVRETGSNSADVLNGDWGPDTLTGRGATTR